MYVAFGNEYIEAVLDLLDDTGLLTLIMTA